MPAGGEISALRTAGVFGLSHVAPGGKRAPHLGATCVLHNFHFEIRHFVDNRFDRITAAIDALFPHVLHFLVLFSNSSLSVLYKCRRSAIDPDKQHSPAQRPHNSKGTHRVPDENQSYVTST